MICPLCDSPDCALFERDERRAYVRCGKCGLIFVPAEFHVNLGDEKKRYELHDNTADHQGYVRHLNELADAASVYCKPGDRILDFGCGEHAVLTGMLRQRGFDCAPYDPLYGIGAGALEKTYDAVILCEVIEHLRDLKTELQGIGRILSPRGKVIVRTQQYQSPEKFRGWWYKEDRTHINFFSSGTLDIIAEIVQCGGIRHLSGDIVVLDRG